MAKLSKAAVKEKIAEWESLGKKVERAEGAMAAEIEPFLTKFEIGTKAIRERHEPKIQKLRDRQAEIAAEVLAWLDAQKKDVAVQTETAIAERMTGLAARVVDVKKFLAYAKTKGDAVYSCMNVLIAKAETLLGKKELDKISTRPPATPTTRLRLK